jgi:hypothetical protein
MMKIVLFIVLCSLLLLLEQAFAQDIEPRRWTPLPMETYVIGIGYADTSGDLFFDPVLQVQDAEIEMETLAFSYVQSFSLAGKLARFDAIIPWKTAKWEGVIAGDFASTERTGFADPKFRFSINLVGAPALGPKGLKEHAAKQPLPVVVGAAVTVSVPLGEYLDERLLNLGGNRYSIRPQLGLVYTRGAWSYELTGSVFFYTDNDDFFNGKRREQDPLYALQTHLVHVFKPGLWVGLSVGYSTGGESKVDGDSKDDKRDRFLSGISMSFPIARNQGVKLAYIRNRAQKDIGSDTDTMVLGWTVLY